VTDQWTAVTDEWSAVQAAVSDRPTDRAAHVFAPVASWLFSPPMAQLLAEFGERLPDASEAARRDTAHPPGRLGGGEELPGWLDRIIANGTGHPGGPSPEQVAILRRALAVERIAANHFNFRTPDGEEYRERSQAVAGDLGPDLRDRVAVLARQLGLVSTYPPRFDRYDKTLVLGGGHLFPLLRARYAAQLRAAGSALGELNFLGSPRFLIEEPSERLVTESYAPGAADEFDLMVAAACTEFGLSPGGTVFLCGCSSAKAQCPNWPGRHAGHTEDTPAPYTHERCAALVDSTGRTIATVLSASTGRPPVRPDTADTLSLWARCADPQLGQRVLMVTTQVFVPFQTFDGLRRLYLCHGAAVDVVGYAPKPGDPPQTAEYLLQETLSAIKSGRRLLVDAAGTLMGTPSIA
jgi:hypothetical protein